jgi:hypothetical protein
MRRFHELHIKVLLPLLLPLLPWGSISKKGDEFQLITFVTVLVDL